MSHRIPLLTLILAAACAAAPAHADILKCRDAEGSVTLTDLACPVGSHLVQVMGRLPPPPTVAPWLVDPPQGEGGVARITLRPDQFAPQRRRNAARPGVPSARFISPVRLLATDAATLRAARMAVILGDAPEKLAGR